MKILGYVVNFIFVLICCVHVGVVVYIFINPPNPEIKVYEKLLKDIEFPVAFILCVDKIKNSSQEYQDIGYEDVDTFFAGIGKFNGNMGWNGHRGNGTTIGSVESLLDQINVNWSSIFQTVGFFESLTHGKLKKIKDIKWSKVPLFPNCQVFDLEDHNHHHHHDLEGSSSFNGKKEVHKIVFLTNMKKNYALSIYIQERATLLRKRRLNANMLAYSGPDIRIDNLEEPHVYQAAIRFDQFINSDKERDGTCVNYPTEKFESYQECDENFIHQEMLNNGVINRHQLMPFWATSNLSEVTKQRYDRIHKPSKLNPRVT